MSVTLTHPRVINPYELVGAYGRVEPIKERVDVVVVGSGAGGATAAATLAEAGKRVLLLEEGLAYSHTEYHANFSGMTSEIMRHGGATVIMGRGPIPYLEGRVLGGSTVLNGGMCWRTPERVLDEWVERGLERLSAAHLEPYFDLVEAVIDARYQDSGSEGGNNDAFKRGADALGWRLQHNKRNQRSCVGTNDCVSGCPTGAKRSAALTWVPRLLAAGGHVLTGATVRRVVTRGARGGEAQGVEGYVRTPFGVAALSVEAPVVIVACGAVQTPLLLQRSRVTRNPHLGQHFTVHPNAKVAALFDTPVHSLRGVHQAWQCVQFQEEGLLFAPGGVPLSVISQCFPMAGGALEEQMRLAPYIATAGVLVDDSVEGSVRPGPFGWDRVRYDLSDFDQSRFVRGVQLLSELFFAAGARRVYTPFAAQPALDHPSQIERLSRVNPRVEETEYFTAHLMGTCRMSARAEEGVVSPRGEVWGVRGLYVADASVMPGTIGVNPQVTIMALARLIAEGIAG
jgi:choline dehydrogenase-like flavoprotein